MSTHFLRHLGLAVPNRITSGALFGAALFAISLPAGSDPYGTLFTTAAQRAKLDGHSDDAEYAQPISGYQHEKTGTVTPIRLNGTLMSSGGKKEVWLDGRPQLSSTSPESVRIRLLRTDQVQIQAHDGSIAHAMKPGQVFDPETGAVSEYYQQDDSYNSGEMTHAPSEQM